MNLEAVNLLGTMEGYGPSDRYSAIRALGFNALLNFYLSLVDASDAGHDYSYSLTRSIVRYELGERMKVRNAINPADRPEGTDLYYW